MYSLEWRQECAKRDEKFEMHMKALVRSCIPCERNRSHTVKEKTNAALSNARIALKEGVSSSNETEKLIDASQDILAKVLDKKVCLLAVRQYRAH